MKRKAFIVCFALLGFFPVQPLNAQSQAINTLAEAVSDLVGSFLDNPSHHENTEKIYKLNDDFKNTVDKLYKEASYYYNSHSQVKEDLVILENMKSILKCLDLMVTSIVGYVHGGMRSAEFMYTMHPLMAGFGWKWNEIYVSSDKNLVFYEYQKDNFKMVLVKNNLPQKSGGDYNYCTYKCYTYDSINKENYSFIGRCVAGGDIQFVENGDDKKQYKKIVKVESKRGLEW